MFLPAFALARRNGSVNFRSKFSSKKKGGWEGIIDIKANAKKKRQTIEFWTINGLSTSTVTIHEISTLHHELYVEKFEDYYY